MEYPPQPRYSRFVTSNRGHFLVYGDTLPSSCSCGSEYLALCLFSLPNSPNTPGSRYVVSAVRKSSPWNLGSLPSFLCSLFTLISKPKVIDADLVPITIALVRSPPDVTSELLHNTPSLSLLGNTSVHHPKVMKNPSGDSHRFASLDGSRYVSP